MGQMLFDEWEDNFYSSCANVLVCKLGCCLHSVVEQAWLSLAFGGLANLVGLLVSLVVAYSTGWLLI